MSRTQLKWPSDLNVAVDFRPPELLELLYLRDMFGFSGEPLIPKLHIAAREVPVMGSAPELQSLWQEALDNLFRAYSASASDLQNVRASLTLLWGPLDRSTFKAWRDSLIPSRTEKLEKLPEYVAGKAFVDAWNAGLRQILVLPAFDAWSIRLGAVLLLTRKSYDTPSLFVDSLSAFA